MRSTRLNAVILLLTLPLLGSCSKEPKSEPAKASQAAPPSVPTPEPARSSPGEGVGTITGKVVFTGSYAAGKTAISKDREVCGDNKVDQSLVIGKQGELKNAVIEIGDLKQGKSPAKEVELDQVKCEYVPHVAVVPTGGTVKIKKYEVSTARTRFSFGSLPSMITVSFVCATRVAAFISAKFFTSSGPIGPWVSAIFDTSPSLLCV